MLCVSQNAFHGAFCCSLHNLLDVVVLGLWQRKFKREESDNVTVLMSADQNVGDVTHGLLQADRQVNHGHVGGGDTEGHAGQLAVGKTSFQEYQPKSTGSEIFKLSNVRWPVWTDPFSSGMTLPTALAAPVEAGMMFWLAPRPSLHSLPEGPSTVF